MIRARAVQLDLPEDLCLCPECGRAHLTWHPRTMAWRCGYIYPAHDGLESRPCRHAVGLLAIIEDTDLEIKLSTSKRLDVRRLRLTRFALELACAGVLEIPWLTAEELRRRLDRAEHEEDRDEQLTIHDAMMREGVRPHWDAKRR